MATEAQVSANRRNAAKSTGPRTTQGKAIVAQNALRHGLLARQNVVAGEDPGQFEFHRHSMLAELKPAGPTETLFAERIVGLAWRLLRAERLGNQAFDYLLGRELDGSTAGFPDLLTEKKEREMCGSCRSDPGLAVGRMLVKDCGRDKVLERLMLYEQRIESSLRRAIRDLRDLRAERAANAEGTEIPAQWEPQPAADLAKQTQSVNEPPCETKPMAADGPACSVPVRAYQDVSGFKCQGSSEVPALGTSHLTLQTPRITPYGVTTNGQDSAEQSESAATGGEPAADLEKQTQSAAEAPCETKPMEADGPVCSVPVRAYQDGSSFKCEVSSEGPALETSNVAPETPPITPDGVTTNGQDSAEQSQSVAGVTANGEYREADYRL